MSDYILGPDTPLDDVAYVKQKQAAEKAAADAKTKAAAQQKQKQQATETAAKAKKDARFVNPLDTISKARPLDPLVDAIGGKGTAQRQQQKADAFNKKLQKQVDADTSFGAEAIRVVGKGLSAIPEQLANKADLLGDYVKKTALSVTGQPIPKGEDPDKPDEYINAAYSFTTAPKTEVGQMASKILTFAIGMRMAAKYLPGGKLGGGPIPAGVKGLAKVGAQTKRLALDGLVPGAIADILLTDARDGNLSATIKSMVPVQYQQNMLLALATKEGNPAALNVLLSALEGGPLNFAGNALVALIPARKAAQAALSTGKPKEEALAAGVKAFKEETDVAAVTSKASQEAERVRWTDAREAEMSQLLTKEQSLTQKLQGLDPEDDVAKGLQEELDDVIARQEDLDNIILKSADDTAKYETWETESSNKTSDINEQVITQGMVEDPRFGHLDDSPFVPGRKVSVTGARGMTDAQHKILATDELGIEKLIQRSERNIDLRGISKSLGMTVDELARKAAVVFDDITNALKTADDVQITPGDFAERIMKTAGATLGTDKFARDIPTAEGLVALKAHIVDTADQIYKLANDFEEQDMKHLIGGNAFDRMTDRLVGFLEMHKWGANFYGGSLNAQKINLKTVLEPGTAADVMRKFEEDDEMTTRTLLAWASRLQGLYRKGDPEAIDQMRAMVRAMVLAGGDPTKTASFMGTALRSMGTTQMSVFYNSLLSGTKTAIRNMSAVYRVLEAPASIALNGVFKGDPALFRAGMAGFHAIMGSTHEAWQVAARTWETKIPASWSPHRVVQNAEALARLELLAKMAKPGSFEEITVGMAKLHYRWMEWQDYPSKLLMSMDDGFKTIIARQRIAEQSMYHAMTEAKNPLDVEKLSKEYLAKYSTYIDPQTGKILDKGLQHYAEIGTFQNDPGMGINHLNAFLEWTKIGKLVVPFLRTPANILTYQLQHTPFVGRFAGEYLAVKASGDALRVAEYEGREAIGFMTISLGMALGLSGNMTGNTPMDPGERKRWKDAGIRSRSLKVGDTWISYNALEPLSNILAACADMSALTQVAPADMVSRLIGQLGLSIAGSLTERSYFQGLTALGGLADPANYTVKNLTAVLGSTANNMLGSAAIRRQFANAFDPYAREFETELDKVWQNILPGIRNAYPVKPDVLTGKPMLNPNGGWNSSHPFETSPDNKDPVARMLMAARFTWGDTLEKDPNGVEMKAQWKYDIRMEMSKNGLREELDALRKQSWYKEDVKKWGNREIVDSKPKQTPRYYKEIQDIWQSSRDRAYDKLEGNNAAYAEAVFKERKEGQNIDMGAYSASQQQQRTQEPPTQQPEQDFSEILKYAK
jgi:hypothetical protein